MLSKKILVCAAFIFTTVCTSFGQIKKEKTTVNINIEKDTVINYKKPHKSVTEGTVTVEGKRIDYKAVAGLLLLKNSLL